MPKSASFDYGSIPTAEARARLKAALAELLRLQGTGADTLKLGERLIEVQAIVLAGKQRGGWSKFRRGELRMSPNTATRFMRSWRIFGQLDAAIAANIQRTALTEMAGEYVPDELRREAIELARGGQFVSMAMVAELLDAHGLARPARRIDAIAGVGNRYLHKIRSGLKMAFEQCPDADRGKLVRELQSLVAELAAAAGSLDEEQMLARRLRTRRIPACPSLTTAVASVETLLAAGVPI